MEINPLVEGYHDDVTDNIIGDTTWNDPDLKRIIRLRLLTDRGFPFYDVSYCHGQLKDGNYVNIYLPFSQLPKRWYRKAIIDYAKRDKVFAKGLGIFDSISILSG